MIRSFRDKDTEALFNDVVVGRFSAIARALSVPPNRIGAIVNGRRAITADTALRLGKYFGTSPEI